MAGSLEKASLHTLYSTTYSSDCGSTCCGHEKYLLCPRATSYMQPALGSKVMLHGYILYSFVCGPLKNFFSLYPMNNFLGLTNKGLL